MVSTAEAARGREVVDEPVAGESGGGLEGAGLLEQVGRAGDDLDPMLAGHLVGGLAVEFEHLHVATSDDEQRRRPHGTEARCGEVWSATTRDHSADGGIISGCPQRRGSPVLAPKYPMPSSVHSG